MKEAAYKFKTNFLKGLKLFFRNIARIFRKTRLGGAECFSVPIIINNRNRLTFLKELVEWLEKAGYKNVFILDNDSTYTPLLEYYKTCPAKVLFLKKNLGYKALWFSEYCDQFRGSYYVYTDPDVLPNASCPSNVIERLYDVLQRYPQFEKAGVALRIDDIPDHYSAKAEVMRIEKKWWKNEIGKDIYDSPVDTTFALYRPLAWGDAEDCRACRVAGDIIFKHQPWYENSAAPTPEDQYYRDAAKGQSSYWMNIK